MVSQYILILPFSILSPSFFFFKLLKDISPLMILDVKVQGMFLNFGASPISSSLTNPLNSPE